MPEKSGQIRQKNRPDILLGSGSVDPSVLSRVIESFYGESVDDDDDDGDGRVDRRRYKGKHQKSTASTKSDRSDNSPMYIRMDS